MPPSTTIVRRAEVPLESYEWGELQWLVAGRTVPGCEQTFGISTIGPGRRNPLHYHPNCEEILHVVAGTCEHSYDGATTTLGPGDTIVIPVGVKHNLVNTGPTDVVCVISFSSPNRETVFLE